MTSHIPQLEHDLLTAARHRATTPRPSAWLRRPRTVATAGLAAAVIATGLAIGTDEQPRGSDAPQTLQASFAVFRRTSQTTTPPTSNTPPSSPKDRNVPTTFDTLLDSTSRSFERGRGASKLTLDTDSARQLNVSNAVVIVAPAQSAAKGLQTCLLVSSQYNDGGSTAGCESTKDVKERGLFSYSVVDDTTAKRDGIPNGSHTVDGLVPDGATDVAVISGDDRRTTVTVAENAMSTTVPERPTAVTFTDANGAPQTFRLSR